MQRILMWMTAGTVLLFAPGAATRLEAQCMGCVSSSACGESSSRGTCRAECLGSICACSDNKCIPTITAVPTGTETPARVAVSEPRGQERSETHSLIVQYCDGQVELLVYSADGTRLIESRLLSPPPAPSTRLARAEPGRR